MEEYYTREVDENGNITFKLVDFDHVKICGYTLKEVVDILRGLDIERATGITMTVENLRNLFNKLLNEQREKNEQFIREHFRSE